MSITITDDKVILTLPNGSSAEILFYGATVISWCAPSPHNPQPRERLYTSRTALLDGSKPVRGGIPLVFPFFGPPSRPEHARLPQHGFARSSTWSYTGPASTHDDGGLAVRFLLPPRDDAYPALTYTVALSAHALSTSLALTHSAAATAPIAFQTLFHTYIRAHAPAARISALHGTTYRDKLQPGHPVLRETRARVDVCAPTDSVYIGPSGTTCDVETGEGAVVRVTREGVRDVVVWNPGDMAGRKIADLEEGGWDMFLAVEPGAASYWIECQPGETWTGVQTLTVVE